MIPLQPPPVDVALAHDIRQLLESKGWRVLPLRLGQPKRLRAVSAGEDLLITIHRKEVSDE